MNIEAMIAAYSLKPHPYEGWFCQDGGQTLQAFGALDEAHWHWLDDDLTYTLEKGGPAVVTVSSNRQTAKALRLRAGGDSAFVPASAPRAISCLGEAALIRLQTGADFSPATRYLMPEDWYPRP